MIIPGHSWATASHKYADGCVESTAGDSGSHGSRGRKIGVRPRQFFLHDRATPKEIELAQHFMKQLLDGKADPQAVVAANLSVVITGNADEHIGRNLQPEVANRFQRWGQEVIVNQEEST